MTSLVSKELRSREVSLAQPENILSIHSTLEVLRFSSPVMVSRTEQSMNKFERDVLSKFEQLPSMTAVVTVSRKLLFHEVDELNVIAPSGIAE